MLFNDILYERIESLQISVFAEGPGINRSFIIRTVLVTSREMKQIEKGKGVQNPIMMPSLQISLTMTATKVWEIRFLQREKVMCLLRIGVYGEYILM